MLATMTVSVRTPSRPAPPSPPRIRTFTRCLSPNGFGRSTTVADRPSSKTWAMRSRPTRMIRPAATAGAATPRHQHEHQQAAEQVPAAGGVRRHQHAVARDDDGDPEQGDHGQAGNAPHQDGGVQGGAGQGLHVTTGEPEARAHEGEEHDERQGTEPAAARGEETRAGEDGAEHRPAECGRKLPARWWCDRGAAGRRDVSSRTGASWAALTLRPSFGRRSPAHRPTDPESGSGQSRPTSGLPPDQGTERLRGDA